MSDEAKPPEAPAPEGFWPWLRRNYRTVVNHTMSTASVVVGAVMSSGYVEDPRFLKACGLASMVLAALGFQRSKPQP